MRRRLETISAIDAIGNRIKLNLAEVDGGGPLDGYFEFGGTIGIVFGLDEAAVRTLAKVIREWLTCRADARRVKRFRVRVFGPRSNADPLLDEGGLSFVCFFFDSALTVTLGDNSVSRTLSFSTYVDV